MRTISETTLWTTLVMATLTLAAHPVPASAADKELPANTWGAARPDDRLAASVHSTGLRPVWRRAEWFGVGFDPEQALLGERTANLKQPDPMHDWREKESRLFQLCAELAEGAGE
jgi:hypothetical protein